MPAPARESFPDLPALAKHLREELESRKCVLLYAYNGTGKTRLSTEFKNLGKHGEQRDTLYFNAFTEDLFQWDNDLTNDRERVLKINNDSRFFAGLGELEMDNRIRPLLDRYADFDFRIDTTEWEVSFSREVQNGDKLETVDDIKVSRGEENIFIWCFFLAIVRLVLDGAEAYKWVKYIYIVIKPKHLWTNIAHLARTQSPELLRTLQKGFKYIEEKSFESTFQGLFSEINLASDKLGRTYEARNAKLCSIVGEIARGLALFSTETDSLGDAYEYLLGQFAAGSGKKAGEFYTPQRISDILSAIVSLDGQEPATGPRKRLESVFDFACGSGSLLLNVRHRVTEAGGTIGKIYGQESNITTYNLARMNMLLHGVKDTEFEIYHGDSLRNDWDMLRETNPAKMPKFDAVVANPPFSYRWDPTEALGEDVRFKNYGLAPKSAADFAFLLHGFHYLNDQGVMAIILPHGVLFRGGAEERIRTKLLKDGHIDTVIGLPANLFYSTGIPVCILVLKRCKKPDDVLFINASGPENFTKGKRQNYMTDEHIARIIKTYRERPVMPVERYARRVEMNEIEANDYNLNISRYVSIAQDEAEIDLKATHAELVSAERDIVATAARHNVFLKELGLPPLPSVDHD